jgi:hypothetical protein
VLAIPASPLYQETIMHLRVAKVHLWLFAAVLAVAFLPLLGSLGTRGGLPPLFGHFPPCVSGATKPGFSWIVFGAGALGAAVILAFLLLPRVFGFRERGTRRRHAEGSLPWWFWVGLVVMCASWYEHWFGTSPLVIYTFVPLWWGFILSIDGLVFLRTGGRSLLATETERFAVITLVSIPAWGFFEFLNFYAVEFWVYPRCQFFSATGQTLWYLLSFSVVLPAIFEWYTLLHTFDGMWNRWQKGPAIAIPRRATAAVFVIGLGSLVAFGAFPFQLFALLWVGPPLVLTAALAGLGFWTPFRPIARGNWSPAVLAALASLANGVFWELWNYGSEHWRGQSLNPNYWIYEIPYVERFHFFSRMPLLGYFGYLPFGGLAWACWLVAAHLLDLEPSFEITSAAREEASSPRAPAVISR